MVDDSNSSPVPPTSSFGATRWSLIVKARDRVAPDADAALASLCQAYWYPLYVFIRRQTGSADEAEDLTQEFFARFLEKDFLGDVDRAKGRFRNFLLVCCKHFLSNERDRARAQKRGRPQLSLDFASADGRYGLEPAHDLTPERLFERRWALNLLDQSLEQLGREFSGSGHERLYERLKPALLGAAEALPYAQIGRELGMTEGAVKKAAQRLRLRYRTILRERIAATVDTPQDVDDEVRALFAALST
jgi:RNA polymerase sigma factor (sigma-70 family)